MPTSSLDLSTDSVLTEKFSCFAYFQDFQAWHLYENEKKSVFLINRGKCSHFDLTFVELLRSKSEDVCRVEFSTVLHLNLLKQHNCKQEKPPSCSVLWKPTPQTIFEDVYMQTDYFFLKSARQLW